MLILSAGVAITGGVKACSFYRQVSRQQYECLEGLLVQEQVNIHRKRHAIVLELENGSHVQRFWMDDINSKLEAYIDFTSKNADFYYDNRQYRASWLKDHKAYTIQVENGHLREVKK